MKVTGIPRQYLESTPLPGAEHSAGEIIVR